MRRGLLLNWLMSREGQIALIEELGTHSGRKDIVTHVHFRENGAR